MGIENFFRNTSKVFSIELAVVLFAGGVNNITGLNSAEVVDGNLHFIDDNSPTSVALIWDPNSEPDVAGYKIYYGAPSGNFSTMVNAGNVTNTFISTLNQGETYSFFATCYNTSALESDPSNIIEYTPPIPNYKVESINYLSQTSDLALTLSINTNEFSRISSIKYFSGLEEKYTPVEVFSQQFIRDLGEDRGLFLVRVPNFYSFEGRQVNIRAYPEKKVDSKGPTNLRLM
jgi:hypothetical protein